MKRSEIAFGLLRIPMDMLAASAALLLSYRLREANIDLIPNVQLLETASTLPSFMEYIQTFVIPGLVVLILLAALMRLYALRITLSAWEEVGRVVVTAFIWIIGVMAWYFLVQKQLFYSRILLVHSTFFIILFMTMGRTAILLLQRALMRHGFGVHLVVSVGLEPAPRVARKTLQSDMRYEYVGHVSDLGALKRLKLRCHLDLVLQTDPAPGSKETIHLIDYCRSNHIGYAFLPPVFTDVPHQLEVQKLGLLPMMRFQPTPLDGWGHVSKRIFDFLVSTLLLVALSPILLLIALIILITSGMPIFYVSKRVGERAEKTIPILKFRSMIRGADKRKIHLLEQNERKDGPLFKIKNDPRVTRFGRFLRRFDLDELPQLFNVLIGHMSLVGPRPHLPEEVDKYQPYERRVFTVKPGITGLAQVSGRSDLTFRDEVKLDLQYIEEWSLMFDLWILWRTLMVVLLEKNSKH